MCLIFILCLCLCRYEYASHQTIIDQVRTFTSYTLIVCESNMVFDNHVNIESLAGGHGQEADYSISSIFVVGIIIMSVCPFF